MPRFERTQKDNPHELTINQHVFPVASIKRFADCNNKVETYFIEDGKYHLLAPKNSLFVARRSWNQRAEVGYMKEIEDKFQQLAEKFIDGRLSEPTGQHQTIINEFFVLWGLRSHYRKHPVANQKLHCVSVEELTKDDEERLEKSRVGVIRADGSMAGRDIEGAFLQLKIFQGVKIMKNARWGLLRYPDGEFIVPDEFRCARIIPITPKLCLFADSKSESIDLEEVRKINQSAIKSAEKYYFARSLTACPK